MVVKKVTNVVQVDDLVSLLHHARFIQRLVTGSRQAAHLSYNIIILNILG